MIDLEHKDFLDDGEEGESEGSKLENGKNQADDIIPRSSGGLFDIIKNETNKRR